MTNYTSKVNEQAEVVRQTVFDDIEQGVLKNRQRS